MIGLKNGIHPNALEIKSRGSYFKRKALPWMVFFLALVAGSPVLPYFGWRGIYTLAAVLVISIAYVLWRNECIKWWFVILFMMMLVTSTITATYWGDFRYTFALVFLYSSFFLVQYMDWRSFDRFVDLASLFLAVLLVFSVAGYILAAFGAGPLFSFPNPGGQPNYYFYTTLTNVYQGDFIRPSGIYDEPGRLSLYVCSVAAIRHLMNKDSRMTWVILLLGFVTFSLAHLVYAIFHFISERWSKQFISMMLMIAATGSMLFLFSGVGSVFEEKLLSRAVVAEDGILAGDNRSFRMYNAADLVASDHRVFWFGADPSCRFDYDVCKAKFPLMGENPLFPLVSNGILVSWPYYGAVFVFLVSPLFGRKYWVVFGFGLLMLQRPEVMGVGVSMLAAIILWLLFYLIGMRKRRLAAPGKGKPA